MEEKQLRQPEEEQLRPQQSEMRRASAQPDGPHLRHHPQRDEDAEALQQALLESEECVPRVLLLLERSSA